MKADEYNKAIEVQKRIRTLTANVRACEHNKTKIVRLTTNGSTVQIDDKIIAEKVVNFTRNLLEDKLRLAHKEFEGI